MSSKPTIYVTTLSSLIDINFLLYGMEEEEIPSQLFSTTKNELIEAAYEQAIASPLSVGIAVDEKQAVLHFKNLPEKEPLFIVDNTQEKLMTLGKNAARLVKGMPFKLDV